MIPYYVLAEREVTQEDCERTVLLFGGRERWSIDEFDAYRGTVDACIFRMSGQHNRSCMPCGVFIGHKTIGFSFAIDEVMSCHIVLAELHDAAIHVERVVAYVVVGVYHDDVYRVARAYRGVIAEVYLR